MKVVFFQPYLAAWRLEFLERFKRETSCEVVVYDGGYKAKSDDKSVTGNETSLAPVVLSSSARSISFRGVNYPIYFSPFLFFSLLKDKPDVVVTEGEINILNNISVFAYCKIFSKKYIWWSLGKVRARKQTLISRSAKPLIGMLIKGAHKVVARNTYAKDYYITSWGLSSDDVVVAPNSMDEERAVSEIDDTLGARLVAKKGCARAILYVGALTAAKRPHDLVRLVYELNKERRDEPILLWFVGDGPVRSEIEELVDELGLSESVTLFGRVTKGVGSFFQHADVTVVPGLGGLVINHAMIFGCPVVSGAADGTELDLVEDGQTGFLIHDEELSSLKEAVDKVLFHPNPEELRQNCRSVIDNRWNMRLMIDRFEQAITSPESKAVG